MTRSSAQHALNCWTIAAYVCISVALIFVVLFGVWGAYRDLRQVHAATLREETTRLRYNALRVVGHIESRLQAGRVGPELGAVAGDPAVVRYWGRIQTRDQQQLYLALVDSTGLVVMHSHADRQGGALERRWYDRVVAEAGGDVLETVCPTLTGGERCYDIRTPIMLDEQEVGAHHVGFDALWFGGWVRDKRGQILRKWAFVISGTLMMVVLAGVSLFYVARRKAALGQAVNLAELQRFSELGQVAAGLAHEIRNPLHAIRLNLHSLGKAYENKLQLSPDEVRGIIRESNREIDRMDRLMSELLGFAKPETPRDKDIDVVAESRATLNFVRQEMARKQLEVRTRFADEPLVVHMDPARLRQILLNLLVNAMEVLEEGGQVEVALERRFQYVRITVADNGPGIPQPDREQIFEPFYSTKQDGTGLGLALVKRFVSEAQGSIRYEDNGHRGARFRIELPAAKGKKT